MNLGLVEGTIGALFLSWSATMACNSSTDHAAPGSSARYSTTQATEGSTLPQERQHVLDVVIADLQQHYFDPAVAQKMADGLVAHQRHGDDAAAPTDQDFAALLTAQMREVSHDLHVGMLYTAPQQELPSHDLMQTVEALTKDNCSFKKVEVLPHNIGYIKINALLSPNDCGRTASAAMATLNDVDALIFDFRDNVGGTSEMVSLIASYLFDHPEYMFDPRRVPTPQSWTASPVPGSKLTDKPVYILTSHTTISGAEQFTYDLKMLKRATIVGEVTAGGAHAGVFHRIDDRYGVFIPENRAVNPYATTDWEAVGIAPDIKVPAADALQVAVAHAQTLLRAR